MTVLIGILMTGSVAALGTSIVFDLRLARWLAFGGRPRREYLATNPKAKVGVWWVGVFFTIAGVDWPDVPDRIVAGAAAVTLLVGDLLELAQRGVGAGVGDRREQLQGHQGQSAACHQGARLAHPEHRVHTAGRLSVPAPT
ncbi:hypothetical protein DN069_32365 [Streptacidiphilus pinicola]|uniref:Uncharacterized protein n=1 Tax=Streptacidiphilus pinicola TaxID=2219663 RepID=A0A2X0K2L3_9ACTN|nr:hypothetical protein DN069_32365 [Streptacidiphilus pinicola]